MSTTNNYRPGDNWVLCDVCGFKHYASDTRKRWDGLRVCRADYETRDPQDFVKGRKDQQRVSVSRPEPADTFVSPNDVKADDL